MQYLIYFTIVLIIGIFGLFNIGNYLDISMKPQKVDIIISLNEGIERVNKSLSLIDKGYSKYNLLLLTYKRKTHIDYILKKNHNLKLVFTTKPFNTAEEVRCIKEYMLKYHYKSAIIVSDPPHTRRIKILTQLIKVEGNKNFKFIIIGSHVKWWNKDLFYKNKKSFRFVFTELIKIPYTYIWYGGVEKLGLKWNIHSYENMKLLFNKIIYFFMKKLGFED